MNSGAVPEMWKNGVAQIDAGGGASGDGRRMLFSSIVTARPNAIAEPMCTRLRCVSVAPFGRPGRPRREEDHERVVLVDARPRAATRRDRADVEHRRALDADLGQPLEPRLVAEQHRRLRELHAVRELGPGPPAVEPDDDRAEAHHRELRERVVEAVGARERDPVALADAVLVGEHRRDRAGTLGHLARTSPSRRETTRYGRSPNCVGAGAQHLDQVVRPLHEHLALGARARSRWCARTSRPGPQRGRAARA